MHQFDFCDLNNLVVFVGYCHFSPIKLKKNIKLQLECRNIDQNQIWLEEYPILILRGDWNTVLCGFTWSPWSRSSLSLRPYPAILHPCLKNWPLFITWSPTGRRSLSLFGNIFERTWSVPIHKIVHITEKQIFGRGVQTCCVILEPGLSNQFLMSCW